MVKRFRCHFERAWLRALRVVFRFDSWHANAPYACRAYKKAVVDLANSVSPVTVVEVGCGLGEILSRIIAKNRCGVDADARVIRAARFLHSRRITWIAAAAAKLEDRLPPDLLIDCLIMVNWIHNLTSEELAETLVPLLPRTRYLILDAVDQNAPASYRIRHDFAVLAGKALQIAAVRVPDEPRRFILFKTAT